MRRRIAETLALVLVPLLSGCGTSAGDEYVGEWSHGARQRLEITRQGESTFEVETRYKDTFVGLWHKNWHKATLNDDGTLMMRVYGRDVPLVIDEVSGKLTRGGDEYIRSPRS